MSRRVVSVVLDDETYIKLSREVETRKLRGEKCSMSQLVGDALRPPVVVEPAKPTVAEIAARFGIKTGATIEEVEPRLLNDDPTFGVPFEFTPDATEDEIAEEIDWEALCNRDYPQNIVRVVAPKRLPGWAKMDWEQRYAALKEAKERES